MVLLVVETECAAAWDASALGEPRVVRLLWSVVVDGGSCDFQESCLADLSNLTLQFVLKKPQKWAIGIDSSAPSVVWPKRPLHHEASGQVCDSLQ